MTYNSKLLNQAISNNTSQNVIQNSNSSISLMMMNPDEEPIIQIDADLRTITIPEALKNIAVVGDHLSETIYFNCPRYFDGEDLSNHTCIIRFINAGNEYGESEAVDLEPEETTIKFGWAIDNQATKYSGDIDFTVQFETTNNGIQYQWQTTPATLTILPALDIDSTISGNNETLFRALSNQVADLQKSVNTLQEYVLDTSAINSQIENLKNEIDYLKSNVVYTLSE